ncbi:uncharacterized protein LOC110669704 [Hevea brasiliensis]|uniref:uncharacterized protein LOC110669704 n=1 Tax=Hevea brasiliensis TaxID=3981 RepID=UPI0025EF6932|nr:uncharacterized protein LOC110669704 [Hevea brasiliensis]
MAHLLKITGKGIGMCKKVMNDSISEMRKQEDKATNRITHSQPRAFDLQTIAQLDAEIARMFYAKGLPFNFARNPYYVSSYSFVANHVLGGYVPLGYNKLRTTLLQQEKANVERLLEPIKSTWLEKGVIIVSDGWSGSQRRLFINFMVVSESGPMFIKSVDCSSKVKDKQFIANLLKEVIDEVGHQKVVQVITDNASNCKAKNLETNQETYDVCHWITEIYGDALQIKNFIMNHSMRLAIYNRFSPLKLLSVADTHFASIVVMLKRFKLIKRALEAMVMSDQWAQYREYDQGKARFVRNKVVDEDCWEKVDYILAFTGPIYDMIRVCDTYKPCLHLVYELWDSIIENVKQVIFYHEGKQADGFFPFYYVVHRILVDRWAKSNTPLHCLAHSLNPSEKWLQEGEGRVPPHMDGEILGNSGHVLVPMHLYFKGWLLKCLDNLLPPLVVKEIGDVSGDQFGSMEDVGVLEFANLSLDEPELESILFDENATTSMEKEKDSKVEKMS